MYFEKLIERVVRVVFVPPTTLAQGQLSCHSTRPRNVIIPVEVTTTVHKTAAYFENTPSKGLYLVRRNKTVSYGW